MESVNQKSKVPIWASIGDETMRPYIAFYQNKKLSVNAETSYSAQLAAAKQFKTKKTWEVTVLLADTEHSGAVL